MTKQEFIAGWLSVKINFSLDYPKETVEFWKSQLLPMDVKDYEQAIQRINGQKWYKTDSLYERAMRAMDEIQQERRDNYRPPDEPLMLPPRGDPKAEALVMGLVKKFGKAMKRGDKQGMATAQEELKEFEKGGL